MRERERSEKSERLVERAKQRVRESETVTVNGRKREEEGGERVYIHIKTFLY